MNSRHTIAIVEDEALIRSALTALLRALGFQTVAYESAEAFMGGHSVQNIDCILADQNLPGMSGLELAGYLRAKESDAPLILMTGRDELPLRQKCQELRVPLLIKPLDAATLKGAIGAAMAGRHPKL